MTCFCFQAYLLNHQIRATNLQMATYSMPILQPLITSRAKDWFLPPTFSYKLAFWLYSNPVFSCCSCFRQEVQQSQRLLLLFFCHLQGLLSKYLFRFPTKWLASMPSSKLLLALGLFLPSGFRLLEAFRRN